MGLWFGVSRLSRPLSPHTALRRLKALAPPLAAYCHFDSIDSEAVKLYGAVGFIAGGCVGLATHLSELIDSRNLPSAPPPYPYPCHWAYLLTAESDMIKHGILGASLCVVVGVTAPYSLAALVLAGIYWRDKYALNS